MFFLYYIDWNKWQNDGWIWKHQLASSTFCCLLLRSWHYQNGNKNTATHQHQRLDLADNFTWAFTRPTNTLAQMLTLRRVLFLARSGHFLILTEELGPRWAEKLCEKSVDLADITVHLVGRAIQPYTLKYRIRWFMLKTFMGDILSRGQSILFSAPQHSHWGIPMEHLVCNVMLSMLCFSFSPW